MGAGGDGEPGSPIFPASSLVTQDGSPGTVATTSTCLVTKPSPELKAGRPGGGGVNSLLSLGGVVEIRLDSFLGQETTRRRRAWECCGARRPGKELRFEGLWSSVLPAPVSTLPPLSCSQSPPRSPLHLHFLCSLALLPLSLPTLPHAPPSHQLPHISAPQSPLCSSIAPLPLSSPPPPLTPVQHGLGPYACPRAFPSLFS